MPGEGGIHPISSTLSDWVYEGIVNEKSLLTMHPDYFLLSGGLERALYRIARKHAGTQRGGWLCRVEVLRDKTGSDGSCPGAWCSFGGIAATISGKAGIDHAAMAGRVTAGSSLNCATLSSVM